MSHRRIINNTKKKEVNNLSSEDSLEKLDDKEMILN